MPTPPVTIRAPLLLSVVADPLVMETSWSDVMDPWMLPVITPSTTRLPPMLTLAPTPSPPLTTRAPVNRFADSVASEMRTLPVNMDPLVELSSWVRTPEAFFSKMSPPSEALVLSKITSWDPLLL